MRFVTLHLAAASLLWLAASVGRAAEPGDWEDPSWQLLREAGVHRDGPSLAAYLRDQCGDDADLARIDALTRQLGSDSFDEREEATKALAAVGVPALAKLRAARRGPDAEAAQRAAARIARIEKKWKPELALAAVRVLVRRGATETIPDLVRFLPCADFEELQDAVWFGLDSLTVRQGKIDPSLMEALQSHVPVRRAAAACIVGRRGDAEQRAAVRKLLSDAEPEVRLRAAQGLLAARDKSGVPALVALLEGSPVETAWQAEELLRYVAGEKAPAALVGAGAAADRTACRQAWESWWKEHEAGLDFAKLDGTSRRPGLTLLCDGGSPEEATGCVWLLGCDGVTRWDLRKLSYPSDARLLPDGRVVVAERSLTPAKPLPETGVSARGPDGKVLWRYKGVDEPMTCLPMPYGRLLIAGSKLVIAEVDTAGNETVRKDFTAKAFDSHAYLGDGPSPNNRIIARRPNEASQALEWREMYPMSPWNVPKQLPAAWSFYRLSPAGLQAVADLASHDCLTVRSATGNVEQYGDPNSRSYNPWVWKVRMPGVIQAVKLPTGSVLAGGVGRAVEIDSNGRPVWSISFEEQAQQVHPCLNRVRLGFDAPRAERNLTANQLAWLQGLSSKDAAVRRRTAEAIGPMRRWGQEAGPALIPLLKDPDEEVRDAARRSLASVYPVVPPVVRQALKDKHTNGQLDALNWSNLPARPLQNVDADAENGLLKDDWFAFALELCKDKDPEIRCEGVSALNGEVLHMQEAMSALIEATHDPNAKVRAAAVFAFVNFGPDGKAAIPTLISHLKDEDSVVRGWSAQSLGEIDPSDDRAFPALLEAVQDKDGNRFAAYALSRCKARAKEAIPVLIKMLDARNLPKATPQQVEGVRSTIFFALMKSAPGTDAVVPALAALLRDRSNERDLRGRAAQTLGDIGAAAKVAIPDLEKANNDSDLGAIAAEAIAKIQGD